MSTPSRVFCQILSDIIDGKVYVTIETYVALFVYNYIKQPCVIDIILVKYLKNDNCSLDNSVEINLDNFPYTLCTKESYEQDTIAALCHLPVLVTTDNIIIAGLCAVTRGMIKQQNSIVNLHLLGFKGACLLAPAETSTWTHFCEIDIIQCVKNILMWSSRKLSKLDDSTLLSIGNFESHMGQPIRTHNIYKLARKLANEQQSNKRLDLELSIQHLSLLDDVTSSKKEIKVVRKNNNSQKSKTGKNSIHIPSCTPISELNLGHTFVEGHQITLADIIIFVCFRLITKCIELSIDNVPLTYQWIQTVKTTQCQNIDVCDSNLEILKPTGGSLAKNIEISIPKKFSLYKNDVKRSKLRNRAFTRQIDVDEALNKIRKLPMNITSSQSNVNISNGIFDWNTIPLEAMPEGGELPQKRLERKKHQLQSLAKAVINMAQPNQRIVDFCSGAGHLGIILAYKLPHCKVILLENKEESLMRAVQRVRRLQMTNVIFVQSNLDYFRGTFNIGTSLHACGVATDIVLEHCLNQRANFVCCPCCYGSIQEMHHIEYPRSNRFQLIGITKANYMHIAHCADQAHDIQRGNCNVEKSHQGQYCMDIVDTDRKLKAEESDYKVVLCRLIPENCTPKNRLLIGKHISTMIEK